MGALTARAGNGSQTSLGQAVPNQQQMMMPSNFTNQGA